MNEDGSKLALAAEAWRRIFGFFMSTRSQRDLVLERLGLTPNDARAFASLDEQRGRTMRSLADEWGCDASNATWMVDRLERRGFAERQMLPADKRVKLVRLTPLGVQTKQEFVAGMYAPPPELLDLDRADLEALVAAVATLPFNTGPAQLFQPSHRNPVPDDGADGQKAEI